MLSFVALVAMASKPGFTLASMTRFYHPPNDRRISRFGIYLLTSSGKQLKLRDAREGRWTSDDHTAWASGPMWKDRSHLVWVEHTKCSDELWQCTLPSLKRNRLITVRTIRIDQDDRLTIGERDFSFVNGKLMPALERAEGPTLKLQEDANATQILWKGKAYLLPNAKSRWRKSTAVDGPIDFGIAELGRESLFAREVIVKGVRFIAARFSFTAHDDATLLFQLDPQRKVAALIPIDAEWIRFDEDRKDFVAYSGRRTDPYGDIGGVWTSDIFLGSLPSAKYHRIKLPFSYTTTLAVRP